MRWCPTSLLAAVLLTVVAGAVPGLAQSFDPAYGFRTTRTPHFAIHFHDDADVLAARLAVIAEDTWLRFAARPDATMPPLTHVVLADQSETANGFATPAPRNVIVLYTAAPSPTDLLNPDDWLTTLFVHEFTHIVHLDRAEGWARLARAMFGRAPWTFPNMTLPLWHIEGLATWQESRLASPGAGRLSTGDFLAITREAARADRMPSIDRIAGGLTDWPSGQTPYAFGAPFHEWLGTRYGADAFERLSTTTAGSLPWLGVRSFRKVFERSVGALWREYVEELEGAAAARPAPPATPGVRRLTTDGFVVSSPRLLERCPTCPRELLYSQRTPHDRPALYLMNADSGTTARLLTRFTGRTAAHHDGLVYFDRSELARNSGPYGDLYVVSLATGHIRRLTHGARLLDPDVAPQGDALVATRHATPGQRDLVIVRLPGASDPDAEPSISPLASEPDAQFDAPRWSPDGRSIVASRHAASGRSDVVVIDVDSGRVEPLTAGSGMRWATPAWRPDGRAVLAAGARGDDAFDIYELPLAAEARRRLTTHPGGATWPDVSADGATLVYVGYGVDGFDLYEVSYPAASAGTPAPRTETPRPAAVAAAAPARDLDAVPYSPWSTLAPAFWTPIVTSDDDTRVGAAIGGVDILGYHGWAAAVTWPVRARHATATRRAADWSASYAYTRWRIQPWVTAVRSTSLFATSAEAPDPDLPSALVEESVETGVRVAIQRLATSHVIQVSVARAVDTLTRNDVERERNRSGIRAAWRFSSAQRPGYAISPERGLTAGAAVELVRPALGASGRSGTIALDGRAYLPGLARHHVVALRGMRGATWGDEGVRRLFVLGGGDASRGPGSLASESGRLLRGFAPNTFAGRHVGTFNADYRFPITRPQRGLGTWPLLLHSLHGAVVADVADVWNRAFQWTNTKTSIGAELAADVVVGYRLPLTIVGGVARGHDRSGQSPARTTAYVRVGHAF